MAEIIRRYAPADRPAVKNIYGMDEFARPRLLRKYPRYREYLADEMSYYTDYEPESIFVAEERGQVVGALLGAVDTGRFVWRLYTGFEWVNVTESIFARRIDGTP